MANQSSARDLLLGGLLAVDELVHRLDEADTKGKEAVWELNAELLLAAVEQLCLYGLGPVQRVSRRQGGAALAYGIPHWLVDPLVEPAYGLGALLARDLREPAGSRWRELFESIAEGAYLEELYRLQDELHGATEPPKRLAARRFALAAATDKVALDVSADPTDEPVSFDLEMRRARTDVALVHPRGPYGILLGMWLSADPDVGTHVDPTLVPQPLDFARTNEQPWHPVERRFAEGVDRGRALAVRLLANLGVPDSYLRPWRGVRVELLGLVPPVAVNEESAGLAVALRVLAEIAGLPTPERLGVVCTGSVGRDGDGFVPMEHSDLAAKLDAVRTDGVHRALLHPAVTGWRIISADSSTPDDRWDVKSRGGAPFALDLSSAAELLWGDTWRQWLAAQRSSVLSEAGWRRWEPNRSWVDTTIPFVVPEQVRELTRYFEDRYPSGVVISGPPNSGKTSIAACLGEELTRRGWRVVGLANENQELPESADLVRVIRQAVSPDPGAGRTLLVLDDLWTTGRSNLGVILDRLLGELGISVLAVAPYDNLQEWDTGSALNVPSFVDNRALRRFAEKAVADHPSLTPARALVGVLAEASSGDMWVLTQLLSWAAQQPRLPKLVTKELRAAFVAERLEGLTRVEREGVDLLAAMSLLGSGLNAADTGMKVERLPKLGARRDTSGRWRLPSPVICRLVISDHLGGGDPALVEQRVIALIRPRLLAALRLDDQASVLGILQGGFRYSERVHSQLVRTCRHELVEWALRAEPLLIAKISPLVDAELGSEFEPLVAALCRGLPAALANPTQMRRCMWIINKHRHVVEADNGMQDLVRGLRDGGLDTVMQMQSTPSARLGLLRELERFHHPELTRLVLRHLPGALAGVQGDRADDYITVRRAHDLRRRAIQELAAEGEPTVPVVELNELLDVAEMLDRTPKRHDGIALFINAMILKLMFEDTEPDWDAFLARQQSALRNAMSHSSFGELARALRNLADYHRGLCVRLLNQPELSLSLSSQLDASSPAEVATLLRTVRKLHGKFSRDLLYDRNGQPKAALAYALANRIRKLSDGKGAGLLLSAAAEVDDLYVSRGRGFAHLVAEHLTSRFAEVLLETEHRPSVVSHFVRGLWEASADYLPEVTRQAEELAAQSVLTSARAWGVRLALLLGQKYSGKRPFVAALGDDAAHGERFMSALAERLDANTLLDRMVTTEQPDTFIAHHQLGRALYEELPARFLRRFDGVSVFRRHKLGRPEVVARCCVEVAETLTAAGLPNAGKVVLGSVGWRWSAELRRVRTPGNLSEALRLLRRLDPSTARNAVEELMSAKARGDGHSGFLERQVHRALIAPSTATELLAAVDAAAPGRGADLLRILMNAPGQWHAFSLELAHDQDPRDQSRALLQLVRLGLRRGQQGTTWLERLYRRWSDTMPAIRSPHAIADLIRVFTALDRSWGADLAGRVNVNRLIRRLREGNTDDIGSTWRVIAAFLVTGEPGLAEDLVEELEQFEPQAVLDACGIEDAARLVQVVRAVDPAAAAHYVGPLIEMIDTAISRRHVVHASTHWSAIGWAALTVSDVDTAAQMSATSPAVPPDRLAPITNLWGLTWLSDQPWVVRARTIAWQHVESTGLLKSEVGLATALASIALGHHDAENVQADWERVAGASFSHLVALYEYGADHPYVGRVLRDIRHVVRKRAEQAASRADFSAWRLCSLLDARGW